MSDVPLYSGHLRHQVMRLGDQRPGETACEFPLSSEEGTTEKFSRTFTLKPRPESGLGCLVCAMFARGRWRAARHSRDRSVVAEQRHEAESSGDKRSQAETSGDKRRQQQGQEV